MPILRIDVLRELFVQPVRQARAPGRREALRILRIDVLRELFVQSDRKAPPRAGGRQVHLVRFDFDGELFLQSVGEARALVQRKVKTTGFVVPG